MSVRATNPNYTTATGSYTLAVTPKAVTVTANNKTKVYGAADPKTGACGSVFDLVADPRHNHRIEVQGGMLGEEAGRRLSNYFRAKRGKPPL